MLYTFSSSRISHHALNISWHWANIASGLGILIVLRLRLVLVLHLLLLLLLGLLLL